MYKPSAVVEEINMGNWKEIEVAGRKIRVNTIKWWAWEDIISKKKEGERIGLNDILRACTSHEDWMWWADLDYDPENKTLTEQRDQVASAIIDMNPKLFPKQEASQKNSNGENGAQPSGSPKNSDGPSTT